MRKNKQKWYIPVNENNFAELEAWWKQHTDWPKLPYTLLLSEHPDDDSYFWGGSEESLNDEHPSYQKITLEEFRAITNPNPMSKHPENWYIPLTADNYADIKPWWLEQVEKSGWKTRHLHDHHLVLSNHPKDESHYWSGTECQFNTMHPSYEKITLEQFLQITNPMNTLPTNWYIEVTEENQEELNCWRSKQCTSFRDHTLRVEQTLLSKHHNDGSYYYSGNAKQVRNNGDYNHYQEITLEQFRQITNLKPMNPLPTKWYIEITRENKKELEDWRQKVATSNRGNNPKPGQILLSKHHRDNSYYYADDITALRGRDEYKDYKEITLEQFREITNQKPMSQSEVKTIQISRTLLNQYYEAATAEQREYIINHFKVDGTTTDKAIRELHDLACGNWKPKIKANHPDCFPEESKYFDFSKHIDKHGYEGIVSSNVADSLGLCRNFIQLRNSGSKTNGRAFYLTNNYNWELIKEGDLTVLIPTKKVK